MNVAFIIILIAIIVFGSVILGLIYEKPFYVLVTVLISIIVLIVFIK
jgi:hypothetical protein